MYSFLLKKALPFTLTFVFGAALGIAGGLFGPSGKKAEYAFVTLTYDYAGRCRMRSRKLVAESKPLNILYKPNATIPNDFKPDATWPWPGEPKGIYAFPGGWVRV